MAADRVPRNLNWFLPRVNASQALLIAVILCLLSPAPGRAQVNYVARFAMEKKSFLLGEPVFCTFSIQNTGSRPFAFPYRNPTRIVNPELESEPRFSVRDATGTKLADPAPRRCGGGKGTAVYGSVTLPPGQVHTERWLINQWARFRRPGKFRLRAERRLPLLGLDAAQRQFTGAPIAYALAVDEIQLEVAPATEDALRAAFQPYERALDKPGTEGFPEAFVAITTLPRDSFLARLAALAAAPAGEHRWNREQALEGLARLGTPAAWEATLRIAAGRPASTSGAALTESPAKDDAVRSTAVLLLAERGDPKFVPAILALLPGASETLRGDALRALGFFHDPRANQMLFERLHSPATNDRVNAILGVRNLQTKDAIPALIAMLTDPEAQVRQVANFALQNLTGQSFALSATAPAAESSRLQAQWHGWWRERPATFKPLPQPPCRDW
jgi:hypothetical protein